MGASNLYPPSRVSENQPKLQPAQHQDKRSVWGGVISPSLAMSPHPTQKMMVNHHPVLVWYHREPLLQSVCGKTVIFQPTNLFLSLAIKIFILFILLCIVKFRLLHELKFCPGKL